MEFLVLVLAIADVSLDPFHLHFYVMRLNLLAPTVQRINRFDIQITLAFNCSKRKLFSSKREYFICLIYSCVYSSTLF
jgi:hypothetical protein